ncbi:MAG: hypothetical protein ABIA78_03810 [archaeon]
MNIDKNTAIRFWMAYKAIEEDFVEIIKFIPFEKEGTQNEITNKDAYSFKFGDIIIRSCTKIDSLLKHLTKIGYIEFNDDERKNLLTTCQKKIQKNKMIKVEDYKRLYRENFMNPKIEIHLRKVDLIFWPFYEGNPINNTFPWWTIYNNLKHDFHNNIKKATLWNSLLSLGALFSITCSLPELKEFLFKNKVIWSPNFLHWIDYSIYTSQFPDSKINLFADSEIFGKELSINKNNLCRLWTQSQNIGGKLPD